MTKDLRNKIIEGLEKDIVRVECISCGWEMNIDRKKISKLRCSCGGKTKKNWRII
jgi:Zn ribbon nucleic-acid-binding protein